MAPFGPLLAPFGPIWPIWPMRARFCLVRARACTDLHQNFCVSFLLSHQLKFQISYGSELLLWRYFSDTRYFKVPIRQGGEGHLVLSECNSDNTES